MASRGYPETSSSGDVIVGTETLAAEEDVDVVHAGTARRDGDLVTAGGRVLAVTAVGDLGRRRPGQGVRGRRVDRVPRRPVAHRHRGRRLTGTVALAIDSELPMDVSVPNVLATRYAGADLTAIWSPEHKVVLERRLWIAVLQAQRDLGVDVPDGVVEAYEKVIDDVDLAASRPGSGSPGTTSRRGSRSSRPSPATSTSTRA